MKLRLRGSPLYYDSDLRPDTDNAVVGKYARSIAAGRFCLRLFYSQGIAE